MSYLQVDPNEIKLASGGAQLQWGMVIGVAIDQILGATKKPLASDAELMTQIEARLSTPGVLKQLQDPSKLSASQKHAIDSILEGAGTKLSTTDLHRVFR
jgi:hypothetical protein